MSEDLLDMWTTMTKEHFYQHWWGGPITGMFFKQGLVDHQPLIDFVSDRMHHRRIQRLLSFTAVDANSGEVIAFDESLEFDEFIAALIGSTSMPFVFAPIKFRDRILIDGGTAWNLDAASAIRRCREIVDDDSKIV